MHESVEIGVRLPKVKEPGLYLLEGGPLPSPDSKPLLQIAMNLANNAKHILLTFSSLRHDLIDRFVILDKGSVDGSRDAVIEVKKFLSQKKKLS